MNIRNAIFELDAMFEFGKYNIRDEFAAALTVFLASSYILFLNPQVMSEVGMDFNGAFFATALAAALGTLLIGVLANRPYLLAPGITVNITVTYVFVKAYGITWQIALAASIFAGVMLFALSLTNVRVWFAQGIPNALKQGMLGGVGLLLVFVGLLRAHLVVASPFTMVSFGNVLSPGALLAIFGLLITALLFIRRIKGAFLLGILLTTLLSVTVSALTGAAQDFGVFALPSNTTSAAFQFDIAGLTNSNMLAVVLGLFLLMFFETLGTSTALLARNWRKGDGQKDLEKIMISDSLATIFGAVLGAPPQTVYAESASAHDAGGKTGLTAVFIAIFFALSVFFLPLIKMVPAEATAAVLVIAGLLMFGSARIRVEDYSESIPALLCLAAIPLTFSITHGIGIAAITYVVLKLFSGKIADVHPGMLITALLFLLNFAGVF